MQGFEAEKIENFGSKVYTPLKTLETGYVFNNHVDRHKKMEGKDPEL